MMMAEEEPPSASQARSHRSRRAGNKQSTSLKNEDDAQRKAVLEAAIRKKIEYERKALQVVECLLEDDINEEFLVNCGKFITPSHYKDVVEERLIIKVCGYPICRNRLQNVPKQKYRISTKTNKVYDITERKCFCSNFCYRASKYFEGQIPKSPVWIREEERPPDIELLKEGESGYSGKEVKLVIEGIKELDVENPILVAVQDDSGTESESSSDTEQEFVSSVLQGNLSSVDKAAHSVPRKSILKKKHAERAQLKLTTTKNAVNEAAEELSRCKLDIQEEKHFVPGNIEIARAHTFQDSLIPETVQTPEGFGDHCNDSQVVFLGVSQKGADQLKRLLAKSKQPVKHGLAGPAGCFMAKRSLLKGLRKTFTEWRTEETLKFLCGSNLAAPCRPQTAPPADGEKEDLDEDDLDSTNKPDITATTQRDTANCLNWPLPFQATSTATEALPSYEKLKEETSQLELKVREFYGGKFILAEEDMMTQVEREQRHSSDQDQRLVPALPLVDSNAQQQVRVRIVLEKLRNVLLAVLGPLQIQIGDVYPELKNLVKTFRLTNTNILHNSPVWTVIAVVLLSVLSENISIFTTSEQCQGYTQFLATLFEELHFKRKDLESLTRVFRSDCLPH
ncbi:putative RNA polymerase II subunit B1 CTD phosphatase RPAP2 [Elgaria multicarinata webbii]|uniref:putative RNA polymerase II subunit B1 CTD phosphatase RPAP2 n=1 Tax=Elgaria multicarinata webbii TaxID=159646 RepID=UPI002FCCE7DF